MRLEGEAKKVNFGVVVLVSGEGTNLQHLIDHQKQLNFELLAVIADRDCYALERAKKAKIAFTKFDSRKNSPQDNQQNSQTLSQKIAEFLAKDKFKEKINLVILAGFLSILSEQMLTPFEGKIINSHPSLLPLYGGSGMYGLHVHKAVLKDGCKETGCSIHHVNSTIDGGKVILQKTIAINADETPQSMQKKVQAKEREALLEVITKFKRNSL
ncbi:MAG: phosphoribosylglycinamide formyltransferase [SAR324 cluster bacterium]|nr:phosphoribosylglycinamide formyltransferase [SAR324 cluster bacterium]